MTSTNDGKEVKSNQTSGQKGKKYYLELYNSIEERLSGSETLAERAPYLCEAWRRIHSICRHAAPPSHPILLAWLERHTACVTLQSQWQSPDSKAERTALDETLVSVAHEIDSYVSERDGCRQPWEDVLLQRAKWYRGVLGNPWGHPVLKILLDPKATPPDEEAIIEWLRGEREVMFVRRVLELVASRCNDMAISLVAAVMDRRRAARPHHPDEQKDAPAPEQTEGTFENILRRECGFTDEGWSFLADAEFALLHKADRMARFIELAKLTPLRNGYDLIDSLQNRPRKAKTSREKKMWKNVNDVAILIAQIMIARCMVVPACAGAARAALYKCAHALCALLPAERLQRDMVALAVPAVTAAHLYTLAKAVHKQKSSDDMKPFVCELYVRALTSGMNELEKLKLQPDKEKEARMCEKTLAAWFLELGDVFGSARLRGECSLTAFSVHPSLEMYDRIKDTPDLPPVRIAEQIQEPKTEISEFGSWACDSRSQTNFVKTSEHLNLKQTQQANVLSTAILNEGEALGLGVELCQDIAVLLSGPRVKTLSWDLDRELLLANCRLHMERTAGGTRALTTELRYLHLDPRDYLHLRDEGDDEDDLYYGIEKGYEHLVEFPEPQPEAVWDDDLMFDEEMTESSYSTDSEDHVRKSRKKKPKRFSYSSFEEEDPLGMDTESKSKEKKKERPHSKERSKGSDTERSKERKKKPKKERSHSKDKEKKERKERKKKIREEKMSTGPLSQLLGIRAERPNDALDIDCDGNSSLAALFAEPPESNVEYDGQFSMDELQSPNRQSTTPPKVLNSTVNADHSSIEQEQRAENLKKCSNNPEVKNRIAQLIYYRRNKSTTSTESSNSPAPSPLPHSNLPKAELKVKTEHMSNLVGSKIIKATQIPKNVLNTSQSLQLSNLKEEISNLLQTCTSPSQSTEAKSYLTNTVTYEPVNMKETCSRMVPVKSYSKNRLCSIPQLQLNYLENLSQKEKQIVSQKTVQSVSSDNQKTFTSQINQPHIKTYADKFSNSPQEKREMNLPHDNHTRQSVIVDQKTSENPSVSHQRSFEDFVKDMQGSINDKNPTEDRRRRTMKPVSKITPIVPSILKCSRTVPIISDVPNAGAMPPQSAKPVVQQKKADNAPNTFSRRSYMHKSKQNDTKPKSSVEQHQLALQNQSALEKSNSEELDKRIADLRQYRKDMNAKQTSVSISKVSNTTKTIKLSPPPPSSLTNKPSSLSDNHPNLKEILQKSDVDNASRKVDKATKAKSTKTNSVLKSALSEKDQQDLINMLLQQNKLNAPLRQANANTMLNNLLQLSSAITITNSNCPLMASNQAPRPVSKQIVKQPQNLLNRNQTSSTQIERKDFSTQLISKATILKTTDLIHSRIMSSQAKTASTAVQSTSKTNNAVLTSVDTVIKPEQVQTEMILQSTPAATTLANASQDSVRLVKRPTTLSNVENKYEPTKKNWTSVMDALRKQKTPSRGPKALEMLLDSNAYEKYNTQNLRNQRIVKSKSELKDQQNSTTQKLTKSMQAPTTATISNLSSQALKQTESIKPKIQINIEYANNQPVVKIQEIPKAVTPPSQALNCETLREDDPFISGMLNSEYELLEELMDDDLRKEIGELSSDEERSYTTPVIAKDSKKCIVKNCSNEVNENLSSVTNASNIKYPMKPKDLCETSNPVAEKIVLNPNKTVDVKPSRSTSKAKPQILSNEKVNIIKRPDIIQQFPKKINQAKTSHSNTIISSQSSSQGDTNNMIITVPPKPSSNMVVIKPDMPYEPYPTLHIKEAPLNTNINQSYVAANNTQTVNNIQLTTLPPVVTPVIVNHTITLSAQTVTVNSPYNEVMITPKTMVPANVPLIRQSNTPTKVMEVNAASGSLPSTVSNKIVQTSKKNKNPKTKSKKTNKPNATTLPKPSSGNLNYLSLPIFIKNPDCLKIYTGMKQKTGTPLETKSKPKEIILNSDVKVDAVLSKTKQQARKISSKIGTPIASNTPNKDELAKPMVPNVKIDREAIKKDESKLKPEAQKLSSNVVPQDAKPKLVPQLNLQLKNVSQTHEIAAPEIHTKPNNMDLNASKSCERKVLSEVQEKLIAPSPEKIETKLTRTQRLSTDNDRTMEEKKEKEIMIDRERLKRKRLAIINREISHRCFGAAIALPYAPIEVESLKISLEKQSDTNVLNDVLTKNPTSNQEVCTNTPTFTSQLSEFILLNSSTPESPGNIENTVQNICDKSKGKVSVRKAKKCKAKKTKIKKVTTAETGIKTDKGKQDKGATGSLTNNIIRVSSRLRERKTLKSDSLASKINTENIVKESLSSETQQIAIALTSITSDVETELVKKPSVPEILTTVENNTKPISKVVESVSTTCEVSSCPVDVEPTKPTRKLDMSKSSDNRLQVEKEIMQILPSPEVTPDEPTYPDVEKVTSTSSELDYKDMCLKIPNNDMKAPQSVASTAVQSTFINLVPKLITNLGDMKPQNDSDKNKLAIVSSDKSADDISLKVTGEKKVINVISRDETGNETINIPTFPIVEQTVSENTDVIPIDSDDSDQNEDFNSQATKNADKMDKSYDIPQSYKNSIIFDEYPNPNDPSNRCLRIQIPNGKTFKATIFGQMDINFDSLFQDPALKNVLLSGISGKQRFTFNVQQTATVDHKIVDTQVKLNRRTSKMPLDSEVVNLISDDEEDDQILSKNCKQKIITEFGTYSIKSMEEDTYKKHCSKLSQKCSVKLNNCDSIVGKPAITSQNLNREELNHLINATLNPDMDESNEIIPLPLEEGNSLKNNSNGLLPTATEIIDLDDSSDEDTPSKTNSIEKIDQLKNLLLKDLGVSDIPEDNTRSNEDTEIIQKAMSRSKKLLLKDLGLADIPEDNTRADKVIEILADIPEDNTRADKETEIIEILADIPEDNTSADKETEIIEILADIPEDNTRADKETEIIQKSMSRSKRSKSQKKYKGHLKLTKNDYSDIIPYKCFVKLTRCDDVVRNLKYENNTSKKDIGANDEFEPKLSRSESFSILNDLAGLDDVLEQTQSDIDRSSPTIDIIQTITALHGTLETDKCIIPNSTLNTSNYDSYKTAICYSDWFHTKKDVQRSLNCDFTPESDIHIDAIDSKTDVSTDYESDTDITFYSSSISDLQNTSGTESSAVPSLRKLMTEFYVRNSDLNLDDSRDVCEKALITCKRKSVDEHNEVANKVSKVEDSVCDSLEPGTSESSDNVDSTAIERNFKQMLKNISISEEQVAESRKDLKDETAFNYFNDICLKKIVTNYIVNNFVSVILHTKYSAPIQQNAQLIDNQEMLSQVGNSKCNEVHLGCEDEVMEENNALLVKISKTSAFNFECNKSYTYLPNMQGKHAMHATSLEISSNVLTEEETYTKIDMSPSFIQEDAMIFDQNTKKTFTNIQTEEYGVKETKDEMIKTFKTTTINTIDFETKSLMQDDQNKNSAISINEALKDRHVKIISNIADLDINQKDLCTEVEDFTTLSSENETSTESPGKLREKFTETPQELFNINSESSHILKTTDTANSHVITVSTDIKNKTTMTMENESITGCLEEIEGKSKEIAFLDLSLESMPKVEDAKAETKDTNSEITNNIADLDTQIDINLDVENKSDPKFSETLQQKPSKTSQPTVIETLADNLKKNSQNSNQISENTCDAILAIKNDTDELHVIKQGENFDMESQPTVVTANIKDLPKKLKGRPDKKTGGTLETNSEASSSSNEHSSECQSDNVFTIAEAIHVTRQKINPDIEIGFKTTKSVEFEELECKPYEITYPKAPNEMQAELNSDHNSLNIENISEHKCDSMTKDIIDFNITSQDISIDRKEITENKFITAFSEEPKGKVELLLETTPGSSKNIFDKAGSITEDTADFSAENEAIISTEKKSNTETTEEIEDKVVYPTSVNRAPLLATAPNIVLEPSQLYDTDIIHDDDVAENAKRENIISKVCLDGNDNLTSLGIKDDSDEYKVSKTSEINTLAYSKDQEEIKNSLDSDSTFSSDYAKDKTSNIDHDYVTTVTFSNSTLPTKQCADPNKKFTSSEIDRSKRECEEDTQDTILSQGACENDNAIEILSSDDDIGVPIIVEGETLTVDQSKYYCKTEILEDDSVEIPIDNPIGSPAVEEAFNRDKNQENIIGENASILHREHPGIVLKGVEYDDPVVGTYYVFALEKSSDSSANTTIESVEEMKINESDAEIISPEIKQAPDSSFNYNANMEVMIPKKTYSRRNRKRKLVMGDMSLTIKKRRMSKLKPGIESRKLSNADIFDSLYIREFTRLLEYCSNIEFSYSISFHKEQVDVENILTSWPIKGDTRSHPQDPEESDEAAMLFTDLDRKPPFDPLMQTVSEELGTEYVLEESCETDDSNFNMGFGERSGRVNQNFKSDGVTKFSAATLSDVKHSQPFLLSEDYEDCGSENLLISREKDQIEKMKRSFAYIQLRDKVRTFFAQTAIELACDIVNNKNKPNNSTTFPFDLYIPKSYQPAPVEVVVKVVQVGQLPVSAAAQNPVTCDPRVTQVSDASPSQCSEENSPRNDLQQGIKTEYTELTTADLSMPMETYRNHNQTIPIENQEAKTGDNIPVETELIKSEVKIELVEETSEDTKMDEKIDDESELPTSNHMNNIDYTYDTNNINTSMEQDTNIQMIQPMQDMYSQHKQQNGAPEKTDQIAHAMSAAGISTTAEPLHNSRAQALVNIISQKIRHSNVNTAQNQSNTYSKSSPITAMALQQALAQILPPPLNQTNATESNQQGQTSTMTPQVLHIVQGKNASGNQITLVDNTQQSVINQNATPVLHIVQNKGPSSAQNSSGNTSQQNAFSGLSLVETSLQQGGNQLLHIVNTGNQKNTNAGQILKRVNLLTNLTNVAGSNDQKMVQFVCKSADGKSIQLNAPHQRSMVLRLQPIESSNIQSTQPKPTENHDMVSSPNTPNSGQNKESANSQQEIKSRSMYEENYAKFIQNSTIKPIGEKSTSLPKFNQAFGKSSFQDGNQKQTELSTNNTHLPPSVNTNNDSTECPSTDNSSVNLDHISQMSSPPLLLRKSPQTSQPQQNLVQQIKQTIAPMNIQTMHGGVIYTRQIPVNIGGGQTINLITVPSTELIDDKQQSEVKFVNQNSEIEPSIIKIVPQSQGVPNAEVSQDDSNNHANMNNDNAQNPQPQPVLTQMRIKLPMLSKTPQVMSGARMVRPSFFQIQRNVIGGANQQVYQQLVLTAAPPLGQQTIRLPQAQSARPVKVSETRSSPESEMSSSTLEQLREFDMVLEQVKERSTVQPNSSGFKLNTASNDTTDSNVSGSSTPVETTQPVLYSIGGSQQLNVAYVNRKTAVATPSTSTFVRSPDSSGVADSPGSSNQAQTSQSVSGEPSSSGTSSQSRPRVSSKSKSRPKSSHSQVKINSVPPKPTTQKPLEDEQTTQRILYILAEYKEQVENSPDKDKPAPRRRSNPPSNPGSSKRKKSSSGSRRPGARDVSPIQGDDTCRTMGSEDSSCGTSQGDCTESCMETHSPQDSPRKVARKLTFEQEPAVNQPRPPPQRNVIVADGQAITVARGAGGKPATAVLMPANYILPVSMVKGGQQIAIVTNRGPKLLTVGGGEGGGTNALLLQRLISPAGLKPVLARPGVRHVRLPTAALHNLQTFNLAPATTVPPPDSTVSPAPAPPELIETRAENSPWTEREPESVRPERPSSPEGSEPWNMPTSSEAQEYSYEETVRAENIDRTVLDPIPDRYSPDMEAQRIFDKMFDVESKKCFIVDSHDEPHCGYGVDASEDDKGYQVVQKKEGPSHRQHRVTHISAAALRHKYAILEHELRLQKSLSEECEDLGVDSPSASELFPEAELLFAASPAQDHGEASHHHPHTPQPTLHNQTAIQPDIDDQIATDQLLAREGAPRGRQELDVNLGLGDVGIVTVSEDGMQATIALDQEEFARSHPNTTFHSEPTDGEVQQPFTITGVKGGRQISTIFHANRVPATVLMAAPQAAPPAAQPAAPPGVKYSDINHMVTALPSSHTNNVNINSVLVKDDGLTRFDNILTDSRELHLSNTASAIVHPAANATQVIRRVCYDEKRERDPRYLMDEPDTLIAGDDAKMIAEDSSRDATMESMAEDVDDENSSSERHAELFWESNSASEPSESRRPLDFSSDSEKGGKSPSYDETNSDSSGVGSHVRHDSVIKEARFGRSGSAEGSSADDTHPPLRTYPPKRMYHNPETEMERSLSGKTRAGEHSPDLVEGRRRTSVRGVVKRGCHCCNGSPTPAAPRPKKPRQRKPTLDFNTNT